MKIAIIILILYSVFTTITSVLAMIKFLDCYRESRERAVRNIIKALNEEDELSENS